LGHLVVGPTGVWVIESQRLRLLTRRNRSSTLDTVAGRLRRQAPVIADVLTGDGSVGPAAALPAPWHHSVSSPMGDGVAVVTCRQLAGMFRHGPSPAT
jgi:hypothetical protein